MKNKLNKRGLIFILTFLIITAITVLAVIAAGTDDANAPEWVYNVVTNTTTNEKTVTITGVKNLTKQTKEFNIPSEIEGYPVTAIGNGASALCSSATYIFGELTLPENLVRIEAKAFENSYIFGKVKIPASVEYIGEAAFKNCDGITEVSLPSKLTTLEKSVFEGCYALAKVNINKIVTFKSYCFKECQALHYIEFGKNARTIESEAFAKCYSLGGIIDNSTLTSIANNAFQNCTKITGFIIPNEKANFSAYSGCTGVYGYYTTDKNTTYTDIDGVLYSKDGTVLKMFPSTRDQASYTVADSATTIGKEAFKSTTHLEKVYLGANVTTLEERAFAGSSITFMYIPDNVNIVEFNTFADCQKLETVILGQGVELVAANAFIDIPVKLIIAGNDNVLPPATTATFYYASQYLCKEHIYGFADVAPTCTEKGYKKCIACLRIELIDATNHSGAIVDEGELSCATDAYIDVDCTLCMEVKRVVLEKAKGHLSNGRHYTIPAGYKSPAVTYSFCTVCKSYFVEDFYASYNRLGDVNCDSRIDIYDVICFENYLSNPASAPEFKWENADLDGNYEITDDELYRLKRYVNGDTSALPEYEEPVCRFGIHSGYIEFTVEETSCKASGLVIRYCSNCFEYEEIIIDRLEHTLEQKLYFQPSCSETGKKVSSCTVCNERITEILDYAPHTHDWYTVSGQRGYEYSSCSVCGTFESREVDYFNLKVLIETLPLTCLDNANCMEPREHLMTNYYKQETIDKILPILDKYVYPLSQREIDENAALLSEALETAQYNTSGAPTVFIETEPTSQDNYSPTRIVIAYVDDDGKIQIEAIDYNGSAKIRGRGSAGHKKTPYNIKFSSKVDLFDMGASKKYCLISNQNDPTLIRNALMYELSQQFDFIDTEDFEYPCQYKIVDVYTGNTYRGSYVMATAVEIGEDRVDLEEDEVILEIEHSLTDTDTRYTSKSPIFNIQFKIDEPDKGEISAATLSNAYVTIANVDFAIKSGNWDLIRKYIDVDSVAKFYILHDYLKEIDIFWDSTRFYIQKENGYYKLHGGPGWDFDYSMFWNKNVIQGGGQGEKDAYMNVSTDKNIVPEGGVEGDSATGVWANVVWAIDSNNPNRLWFKPLYQYSTEFVELVCKTVAKLNPQMSILYENRVNEDGVIVEWNIIDRIITDEANISSIYKNFHIDTDDTTEIPGVSASNSVEYKEKIDLLRDWLKRRNEWMQKFYAEKLLSLKKK